MNVAQERSTRLACEQDGPLVLPLTTARARFALRARPELRTDCSDGAAHTPLPPLSADPELPDDGSVTIGMEMPLTSVTRAFETATPEAGSKPRVHIARAALEAVGKNVSAELELADELCGAVALRAEPAFAGEDGVIELTAGELDTRESARVRAAGLDLAAIARQLARLPRVSTPLALPMLGAAPPALAGLFSGSDVFAQRACVVTARRRRGRPRPASRGLGGSARQPLARAEGAARREAERAIRPEYRMLEPGRWLAARASTRRSRQHGDAARGSCAPDAVPGSHVGPAHSNRRDTARAATGRGRDA